MTSLSRALILLVVGVGVWLLEERPARAGGGPETTLVVANADDLTSTRIANAYARGREIPDTHVLYLAGVPAEPVVGVRVFCSRILEPIEAYLQAEGLADAIETVAYSTGFPYAVSFDAEAKEKGFEVRPPLSRGASLTGLTYFYRHVLAEDVSAYLDLSGNRYYRRDGRARQGLPRPPTREEAAKIQDYQGALRSKDFRRAEAALRDLVAAFPSAATLWYDYACCLAINDKRDEALDALSRAADEGFTEADHAEQDVDLESVRSEPRFGEIVVRMRAAPPVEPARAFSTAPWDAEGRPGEDPASPHRYRMAVMLGWTGAHGMTPDEVLTCLARARACDGTSPQGTVYLMVNDDVRAKTRSPLFPAVRDALRGMGRKAAILTKGEDGADGVLPRGVDDAIGVVAGIAGFSWGAEDPLLLPGAIAEHLTSFGAHFGTPGQTKCIQFLRHGAAGTSGTVAEPFAIPEKFPSPWIHLHYARGCSLAEAFYQSVRGPYQLLVLGDPLARPFARFSNVRLASPDASLPWSGVVEVRATVEAPAGAAPERIELWVDGRRIVQAGPSDALLWNTATVDDGVHDVRLVVVDAGAVATRSYVRTDVTVRNGTLAVSPAVPVEPTDLGQMVTLSGRGTGIATVEVRQGARVLATAPVAGGSWKVSVPSLALGLGETRLCVRGIASDGHAVRSAPLDVQVVGPQAVAAARSAPDVLLLPGLEATWKRADGKEGSGVVGSLALSGRRTLRHDLTDLGAADATSLRLAGLFRAGAGLAELRVRAPGATRIRVDDREILATDEGREEPFRIVLALEAGWHALEIQRTGPGALDVEIELGGSRPLAALAYGDLAFVPAGRARASAPEAATLGEEGDAASVLVDGRRDDPGVDVGGEGVVIRWSKSEKDLTAVVLHPARGKDAPAWPSTWVVETRSGKRGRWKSVRRPVVTVAPTAEAPRQDASGTPRYVVISFDRTSAAQVRVRPEGEEVRGRLAEVEPYVRDRTRR